MENLAPKAIKSEKNSGTLFFIDVKSQLDECVGINGKKTIFPNFKASHGFIIKTLIKILNIFPIVATSAAMQKHVNLLLPCCSSNIIVIKQGISINNDIIW
jgi:hypothetical protein